MIRKSLTIKSSEGLQSRSAALLVQVAGKFASTVWIEQGSKRVNAKSIMGVLSLRLKQGDVFQIVARGDDEKQAVAMLTRLVETGSAE